MIRFKYGASGKKAWAEKVRQREKDILALLQAEELPDTPESRNLCVFMQGVRQGFESTTAVTAKALDILRGNLADKDFQRIETIFNHELLDWEITLWPYTDEANDIRKRAARKAARKAKKEE